MNMIDEIVVSYERSSGMREIEMPYRVYKQHYADCDTLAGSYNKQSKTITVLMPEGRMKPSGTRGKRYSYFRFTGVKDKTGKSVEVYVKAITLDNAVKQLKRDYTGINWNL